MAAALLALAGDALVLADAAAQALLALAPDAFMFSYLRSPTFLARALLRWWGQMLDPRHSLHWLLWWSTSAPKARAHVRSRLLEECGGGGELGGLGLDCLFKQSSKRFGPKSPRAPNYAKCRINKATHHPKPPWCTERSAEAGANHLESPRAFKIPNKPFLLFPPPASGPISGQVLCGGILCVSRCSLLFSATASWAYILQEESSDLLLLVGPISLGIAPRARTITSKHLLLLLLLLRAILRRDVAVY